MDRDCADTESHSGGTSGAGYRFPGRMSRTSCYMRLTMQRRLVKRSESQTETNVERPMRIVVCGATGATGRELVSQAVAQRQQVTAFARSPPRLRTRSSYLEVVHGDVTDPVAVERAVERQDAVLCALGAATPLRRTPSLIEGVRHIVAAMERHAVRRVVYLSFLGVKDGREQLSAFGKFIVAPILLRKVVADHEAKEDIIRKSALEWIIVGPDRLTNGPKRGHYRHGVDIRATTLVPHISRADLAEFMLQQVAEDVYIWRTPAVMY